MDPLETMPIRNREEERAPQRSPGGGWDIPPNAGRTYPPEILTRAEVLALIRCCSHRAPTGLRNRALIATLYRAGIRISEALSLHHKDLDGEAGTIRILYGKGGKARTVAIDPGGILVVQQWVDERACLGLPQSAPLFCTLRGGPVSSSYVRHLLPRLARRAGIEKRVHPHAFRHTHAAELAREGVPVNVIQAQLGHSSLATTSRYLAHIAPADLIRAVADRDPWTP